MAVGWNWKVHGKCMGYAWEMHGRCAGFSKRRTNGTWLQLVRSCTFLLDLGVPDFWGQTNVQGAMGFLKWRCTARVRAKAKGVN